MKKCEYIIKDELGIHARPAGLLVKKSCEFNCDVKVEANSQVVDAKRIFGVMRLGAKQGDKIIIMCEGVDEEVACLEIEKFLNENL